MKRMLAFLLALFLIGGSVFAQMAWSGRLTLGTKMDFVKGQDPYDNPYITSNPSMQSSYGEFSYGDGPFTLSFGLGFNEDPDENDDVWLWNYMGARFTNEHFGVSVGFTQHLEGGMDLMKIIRDNIDGDDTQKMVFEFWETYGWYNLFQGDLELRIAKKGGEPYYWRAATVTLGAFEGWDDGGLFGDGDQAFEARDDGGIWLNYIGIRDLAFGIRLRDPFGAIGFGESPYNFNNTTQQYFKDLTFGAKYDTGDWGASFMWNFRNNKSYDILWGGPGNLWDTFTADMHIGFNYKVMDGFWAYGDVSIFELANFGKDDWWIAAPVINFGLGASYETGPINANLTLMALDLSSAVGKANVRDGNDIYGWTDSSLEFDLFLGGSYENGSLNAGLDIAVYDLADNFGTIGQLYTTQDWGGGRSLHINPSFGYQISDRIDASLGLGWTKGIGEYNGDYQLFRVHPSITLNLAAGASILFSYNLEYDTDASTSVENHIGVAFMWSF